MSQQLTQAESFGHTLFRAPQLTIDLLYLFCSTQITRLVSFRYLESEMHV